MEKNKAGNKKNLLLLIYICLGWFVPYSYSFIKYYQAEKRIQALVIILTFIVTTVLYYVCKNRILRLLVMITAIVCITVVMGYKYALTVYPAFAVIYVYKSIISEDFKNEKIEGILLALVPFTTIVGLIINFEALLSIEAGTVVLIIAFAISFFILMKCSQEKKPDKKTKKSRKTKEIEKSIDMLHQTVFSISIIGVLSSATSHSFTVNNATAFFPWFLFIALLIYEEDKSLYLASEMIVNKLKAFVEG